MLRSLNPLFNPLSLLVCGCLAGCMSAPPLAVTAGKPGAQEDFDLEDPSERQRMFDVGNRELIDQTIAETRVGSQVRIITDGTQYIGTLVKSRADKVELLNCVSHEPVPGPNGIRQCKTSHTPLLEFPTSKLSDFTVLSPPKAGFKVPDITEDASGATVMELVYRDGTRWSKRAAAGLPEPAVAVVSDQ